MIQFHHFTLFPAIVSLCLLPAVHYLLPTACAEPATPRFSLASKVGPASTGRLVKIAADWSVEIEADRPIKLQAGELIGLRQLDVTLPGMPRGEQLLFANGDRWSGRWVKLAGMELRFKPNLGKTREIAVPLSPLLVLWRAPPAGTESPEALRRNLVAETRMRDHIRLVNGDLLQGTLAVLDENSLQLDGEASGRDAKGLAPPALKKQSVSYIGLNSGLVACVKPRGPYGRLLLTDGSRLSIKTLECADGKMMKCVTFFKARIDVPVENMAALAIYQGPAVYLSDLKPCEYKFNGFTSELQWPYGKDRTCHGEALRLAGNTYDKGIAMQSESALTYDVSGYRYFEAIVGLDDRTAPDGSARIKVLVDGTERQLGCQPELTHKVPPHVLQIDLSGARELTLITGFGRRGNVRSEVNWADARLVR